VGPTVFDSVESLLGAAGRDLGVTAWRRLEPLQLTLFAASTFAGSTFAGSTFASSTFAGSTFAGSTFAGSTGGVGPGNPAPPLLVLSLTNCFLPELLEVRGGTAGINYGTGRVRFATPVHGGDRLRGRATLVDAVEIPGGVQTTIECRVEVEGSDEPACVAEALSRWMR
jgi:acyl dehydratase